MGQAARGWAEVPADGGMLLGHSECARTGARRGSLLPLQASSPSLQPPPLPWCRVWHQHCGAEEGATRFMVSRPSAALQEPRGAQGTDAGGGSKPRFSTRAVPSVSPPGEPPARGGFLRQGPPPRPPARCLPQSLGRDVAAREVLAAPTLPLHLLGAQHPAPGLTSAGLPSATHPLPSRSRGDAIRGGSLLSDRCCQRGSGRMGQSLPVVSRRVTPASASA